MLTVGLREKGGGKGRRTGVSATAAAAAQQNPAAHHHLSELGARAVADGKRGCA